METSLDLIDRALLKQVGEDPVMARALLRRLKDAGFHFSMDIDEIPDSDLSYVLFVIADFLTNQQKMH